MKRFALAFALAALAGCSMLPAAVSTAEETAADVVVASAERTICRNIPIGTWRRNYGANPVRAEAWRALCNNPVGAP